MAPPLGITGIHHHSIISTNPNATRHFYGDQLGLQELPTPSTFKFPVIWYACGDEQLHLLIKDDTDTLSPRHIALYIEDVEAARKDLRDKGVAIDETTPIPGADRFFVQDPDGNRIELIQWKILWGDVTITGCSGWSGSPAFPTPTQERGNIPWAARTLVDHTRIPRS